MKYYDQNGQSIASVGDSAIFSYGTLISHGNSDDIQYELSAKANHILISTPIYNENRQYLGRLSGSHDTQLLHNILLPFLHGNGITYVISKEGTIVFSSVNYDTAEKGKNIDFWQQIENTDHVGYDTTEQMEDNVEHGYSGNMIYRTGDRKKLCSLPAYRHQ